MKIKKTFIILPRPSSLVLCTSYLVLIFLFNISISYSQEKPSAEIHKSKKIEVIGGVKYIMHTVEKGQTLYAISKAYERNLSDIVIENPDAIDGIRPGEVLKIPTEKPKKIVLSPAAVISTDTANVKTHKVEQGQTLYALAKQYGTTVDQLIELNPELKEGLKIGQVLKMSTPVAKTESPVTPVKPTTPVIDKKPVIVTTAEPVKPNASVDTTSKTKPIQKPITPPVTIVPPPVAEKISAYPGTVKEEYNIAFFLPFHAEEANAIELEKLVKGEEDLPNKTIVALQFYEGALLAIDSLKKSKLKAKVFVYDVDDTDSLNILNTLKKPELAEMDLIIGPLYGSSFMPVAKFAKEHMIPIISPFTQVNKILFDNPYVCKVLPSSTLQVEQMAHFVVDSFHTQNVILVNNGNLKEVSFYNAFKNTAKVALLEKNYPLYDSIKEAKNLPVVESMLSTTKTNVIVLPSNSQSYVTEFISRLNTLKDKYKIVLFGLQNWVNYDNLDFEYLNGLSLHIPANNYIDFENKTTQGFITRYREKYKTEPELYAYSGFDVTYCFISALQKNGSGFLNTILDTKYQGMVTNFDFIQPVSNKSGFENKFVVILKYKDYKLVKAN